MQSLINSLNFTITSTQKSLSAQKEQFIKYVEKNNVEIVKKKLTELEKICAAGDLQNISTIKRFLKGEIIFENFLEIVGLKEIEVGVIDELFED